jgi:Na+-translocating ferredoxin:NAD+ oxidoreductase RnfG subunit
MIRCLRNKDKNATSEILKTENKENNVALQDSSQASQAKDFGKNLQLYVIETTTKKNILKVCPTAVPGSSAVSISANDDKSSKKSVEEIFAMQ